MVYLARLTRTAGYFLLGDSINTTITLVTTLQATSVTYNTLTLTYLLIVGIFAQVSSKISSSILI